MQGRPLGCFAAGRDFAVALLACFGGDCETWAPVVCPDGNCRLQKSAEPAVLSVGRLPTIPLKKLLLPEAEPVWRWDGKNFLPPETPRRTVVWGTAACDLQALGYLDRIFRDDPLYQARRERLLVVGSPCRPADRCCCEPDRLALGGDLFWFEDRVWALSVKGLEILQSFLSELPDAEGMLPRPEPLAKDRAEITETLFSRSSGSSVWLEQGDKCLSCGACSAVCPTCYCYDMIDKPSLDGGASRQRVWDNCFFADHAVVAGGHDFRPGRAARLRFRFEHKKLGFGALRGVASCVGCGRCLQACPVEIDLEQIAERVAAEFAPC